MNISQDQMHRKPMEYIECDDETHEKTHFNIEQNTNFTKCTPTFFTDLSPVTPTIDPPKL